MEFQLSPDNSTELCQIDRAPPGLHWENMPQFQPTKSHTPAFSREQEGIFLCPSPLFCHYLHSISVVWPLAHASQCNSPTPGTTVQTYWASPEELGELPATGHRTLLTAQKQSSCISWKGRQQCRQPSQNGKQSAFPLLACFLTTAEDRIQNKKYKKIKIKLVITV